MSFPVLLCGIFALGAVAVPVHYPTYPTGYPGKAGKDMVVPYFPAANDLPGMQVAPGSADVNTANAVANMMLASISNGNSGAVSTGRSYGSTATGSNTGTSNGNGVSGSIVNMGTGFVDYIPTDKIGLTIDSTGIPMNSNGANSVNVNTNQNAGVPSLNMNAFMIGTSESGNANSNNVNSNVKGRFRISNSNGLNFNNNNNGFSFNNNNGFNFNNDGFNFNNNNGLNFNNNGFNFNNIRASGANNAANVMVPLPDTTGNVQNGNLLKTENVPSNGPMSGLGMLVHGPDCHIPGQSGNGYAGSNGNSGPTNGVNMVPVYVNGNTNAGTNGQAGKY